MRSLRFIDILGFDWPSCQTWTMLLKNLFVALGIAAVIAGCGPKADSSVAKNEAPPPSGSPSDWSPKDQLEAPAASKPVAPGNFVGTWSGGSTDTTTFAPDGTFKQTLTPPDT